jgi:uncharacterized protein (DUF302 family)
MDIITLSGGQTVKQTIDSLQSLLLAKGMTIYGRIDQQAEAEKSGLALRPMELLLFGNPKVGIPLILNNPLSAIDLPLKVLAWESEDGKVWLSYNDFTYLQNRFAIPQELIARLALVEALIKNALI